MRLCHLYYSHLKTCSLPLLSASSPTTHSISQEWHNPKHRLVHCISGHSQDSPMIPSPHQSAPNPYPCPRSTSGAGISQPTPACLTHVRISPAVSKQATPTHPQTVYAIFLLVLPFHNPLILSFLLLFPKLARPNAPNLPKTSLLIPSYQAESCRHPISVANPKSATLILPLASNKKLSGLTSR